MKLPKLLLEVDGGEPYRTARLPGRVVAITSVTIIQPMPRHLALRLYTNTSPGKAVRVREASVFWIIRLGGASVPISVCRRSIFSLRVRSI